jgi:hypothetical protein
MKQVFVCPKCGRSSELTIINESGVPLEVIGATCSGCGDFVGLANLERAKRAFDTLTQAIEAEGYSVLVDPDGNYSIEPKHHEMTPLMEMGEAIRKHGLPEIDRSPRPFWKNTAAFNLGYGTAVMIDPAENLRAENDG